VPKFVADSSVSPTGLKWAAPAGGGKLLQVVFADYGTETTVASTTYVDTGLTGTITPSSATSKVLVTVYQQYRLDRNEINIGHSIKLLRGVTDIYEPAQATSFTSGQIEVGGATSVRIVGYMAFSYLDSPSTTSATTYKTQGRVNQTTNSGAAIYQAGSSKSIFILQEIAG
jgi:hypothetical protein